MQIIGKESESWKTLQWSCMVTKNVRNHFRSDLDEEDLPAGKPSLRNHRPAVSI